jgi:transposase-like protein
MSGVVVADETWIGPDPTKMNKKARSNHEKNHSDKQQVVSLISKKTGEVRSKAVANVSGATLRKVMQQNVNRLGSVLHTDQSASYTAIGRGFVKHETVNHSIGQYMHHGATTNQAENFFSQLKRSLDGTHHHVSREHLDRYLTEFDFRYSTRKITDTERMVELMARVPGRRLSYKGVSTQ